MSNYKMTVTTLTAKNDDRLNLTFKTRKAAMAAYYAMPTNLSCSFPEKEQVKVFTNAAEAVDSAVNFFNTRW